MKRSNEVRRSGDDVFEFSVGNLFVTIQIGFFYDLKNIFKGTNPLHKEKFAYTFNNKFNFLIR